MMELMAMFELELKGWPQNVIILHTPLFRL